ncbi:hypothetical protein BIW11_06246 [Tropilaelaps mercedesae]|uniref:C2H2-type domain-containing protein n=1 Tax=Tropilaelaps mercedesae TaxID=418985 RepID=A0A1V9XZ99_9ACAR|nr:hypothetical protein BIW11_06246 [Tropilaelaps mercedesae]
MNEDQAQATAQAVQSAANQTVTDVQNAQLQALIQNAAAGGAQIVNSQGLTYNVLGAGAAGVGAQIQNIQIDGQEAIFIPAALTGGATQVAQTGQIVRSAGGSPQAATATAYQNVTIRNGNTIQTIQVPVAAPTVQQTTVVPMQVPVPTANGQTIYQTIHVPIQSLGGVGGIGLGGVGMGGVAQVAGMLAHAGQPMALQHLAGLTAAPHAAQIAQIQVQQQQSSPTTPSSVGATVSTANGASGAASQAQAVQTVASVAGVQPVTQVQQVAGVQSMQQWAADAATAAALAQAQAQAAQVVHQQHQTVALQLPNGQIVQGQQVNLASGATMVYPGGGGMNMAAAQLAAAGLRSPGVIQLANLNGVPVQIQSATSQQQLHQLLQGNAALQALGLHTSTGPLSPLQTIQIAGTTASGQQTIVAQQLQQDPNDPTRWQVVQVPQTVTQAQATAATQVTASQATPAAVTPTTVTVQTTPQQLHAAATAAATAVAVNGDGTGAAGTATATGSEGAPQQIVLVAAGGTEVVTASAAAPNSATTGNGASGTTTTIAPVTSATGTPLASGERRLRRVACTCPNCRDGDGHRTIRPNGEGPGRRQHICHIAGCHKVYGKTSHLRAHLRWHAGERPFVCDWLFCGKGFTRSDELQRHKRTHTGEKRFQCAECLKGFMRSDHLSKHLKTHLASRNGLTIDGGDSDMETIDHMDANGNGVVETNGTGNVTGAHTSIVTVNADGSTETTTVPVGQTVQVAGSVTISGAMGVTTHDVGTAGPTATIMHVVKHEDGQPLQISDGTRIHDVVQIRAEDGTTQLQIVQTTAA